MILPGLDVLFSITFCSTGTMKRCQRAALSRIYICAVTNVIWKLFMATSIGAKGIENRDVIESILNVQKSSATIDQVKPSLCEVNRTRMFST